VISEVLGEAWDVYRRLWRRSVVVAGLVFAIVDLGNDLATRAGTFGALFVGLVLALVGGLLVQGALVEVVRDLHDSREPAPISAYYDRARGRLGTLFGSSLLYGLGVVVGLLLLIVPGLIAVARWSLIVPLVMIERLGVRDAFSRSAALVKGTTGRVLVLLVVATVLADVVGGVLALALRSALTSAPHFLAIWVSGTLASAITVPYTAHVLTVLYYRLTEPERPVLPAQPPRESWRSVWDEEPPA
jgi:hypothetical protein